MPIVLASNERFMKNTIVITLLLLLTFTAKAQQPKDTIVKPLKLSHAEPLYIDLIRDLGARKGEKEINVGFGINDEKQYLSYNGFIEYEFAIANRLGLEIEVPFEANQRLKGEPAASMPDNRIEGIKLATQYTFWVSEKHQTSMAVGYIQEFEFSSFSDINHNGKLFEGALYNPIFIAAKKLTPHIHMLLYTGPVIEQNFETNNWETSTQVNANLHYVFTGGNFVGLETNMEFSGDKPSFVFRPQFKLQFSKKVSLGVLAGIPATNREHGLSGMTRLIWVP
ncbi:hypothetical protein D3C87_172380 [compost metagenome]